MPFSFGDVVWADLDPSAGREQRKRRPLVVVSNDKFNRHCNLTLVVPVNSAGDYPLHIDVGEVPDEAGGTIHGYAETEQVKSLDLASRNVVRAGSLAPKCAEALLDLVLGCLVAPDMMVYRA